MIMGSIMDEKPDSKLTLDELTVACSSLGTTDINDGTYMKDRDCKPCLREIARYLSTDSKDHVARSHLGAINVIKTDLIPLISQYCFGEDADSDLFSVVIRICINLTSSVLLLFENQEIPSESEQHQVYLKLRDYLYRYKVAFASEPLVWKVLNQNLNNSDDDEISFERMIILIRNILHIPVDSTSDMGLLEEFDAHQMCLLRMKEAGLFETILRIASETTRGSEYCFHLMEIIYLMYRDQNAKTLSNSQANNLKRKLDDQDEDKKRLSELVAKDRRERESKNKRIPNTRMFRYTTFIDQNSKTIGNNRPIVNKLIRTYEDMQLDAFKNEQRKAKNRAPINGITSMNISDTRTRSTKISYDLKNFCREFVEKAYNHYMLQIKHNLIQKRTQDNDESYYLWAIQFFTAFNRHSNLTIDNVSETLSSSTLHFIQMLISGYQDKIKMEKKKFHDISKRLHLALRAYREILFLIQTIDENSVFLAKVETIKNKIFGEVEYNTMMVNLFQQYDEPKHSLHYLQDLIECNDVFVELYDKYARTKVRLENVDDEEDSDKDDDPLKKTTQRKKPKQQISMTTAHFMTRYCSPDVVNAYLRILKDFRTNSTSTNQAILRFLERISYDCGYELILCQASVFRCLLSILEHPSGNQFKNLTEHLIRVFGSKANRKRWMFQELLFWKTTNDVKEIEMAIDPPPIESVVIPKEDTDSPPILDGDDDYEKDVFKDLEDSEGLENLGEKADVDDENDDPKDVEEGNDDAKGVEEGNDDAKGVEEENGDPEDVEDESDDPKEEDELETLRDLLD